MRLVDAIIDCVMSLHCFCDGVIKDEIYDDSFLFEPILMDVVCRVD